MKTKDLIDTCLALVKEHQVVNYSKFPELIDCKFITYDNNFSILILFAIVVGSVIGIYVSSKIKSLYKL